MKTEKNAILKQSVIAILHIINMIPGIILRWRVLDHAAHLGGLLFGIVWIKYGIHLVDPLLKWWHEQRRTWIK